jgi:hypothetical protein
VIFIPEFEVSRRHLTIDELRKNNFPLGGNFKFSGKNGATSTVLFTDMNLNFLQNGVHSEAQFST